MSRSQLRNSLTHINPALSSSVAGNWKQLRTAVRFSLAGCMGIEIVSLMNFGCWLGFSWRRERKTNHRPAMLGRTRRDIQIFSLLVSASLAPDVSRQRAFLTHSLVFPEYTLVAYFRRLVLPPIDFSNSFINVCVGCWPLTQRLHIKKTLFCCDQTKRSTIVNEFFPSAFDISPWTGSPDHYRRAIRTNRLGLCSNLSHRTLVRYTNSTFGVDLNRKPRPADKLRWHSGDPRKSSWVILNEVNIMIA